jgi:Domain of unknown function (DUF1707)
MADDARVPALRASDAEREAAIGRLRDAAAEGRLTFEELADRVEAAARAVTRTDLETLTDDLPAELPAPPPPNEIRSRVLFGDIKQEAGETAPPRAPRIVLTGGTVFGDVLVRARPRRGPADRLRKGRSAPLDSSG